MRGSAEILPVRPKTLERLNTRIVEPPEVRKFILAVLSDRLYRETPPRITDTKWHEKLGIMVDYFFRGKTMGEIAKKKHYTVQGVSYNMKSALDILWMRHTRGEEGYPYRLTSLSRLTHKIGIMSQRGLTSGEIISTLHIDGDRLGYARYTLKDLGIPVPGGNREIQSLRRKTDKTCRTSTDPKVLADAFQKLGDYTNNYVIYNSQRQKKERSLLSIRMLMEEARLSHYNNRETEKIAGFLRAGGITVFNITLPRKESKIPKRYFLVPVSLRKRARDVLTRTKNLK